MHYSSISINNIKEGHSCRRNYVKKEDLKTSITTTEGLLEPISVRQQGEDYIVIDGLRRLRAVKELGWDTIDCSILDIDEEKSYLISYIKNTQRNNLNPIEDARHLQTVKERFGYNHEDLVRRGYARHRSTLDDKTRLLTLPDKIQDYIAEGSVIGPSIGYEIANLKDADLQIKLAEEIIARGGMPVRWVKDKVKSLNVPRNGRDKLQEPPVQIPHGEIPGVFFKDASDMSELKDKSVGLIVTSPPYGVGMQYEKGVSFEEHRANLEKVFSECNRVLKPGGKICINFGDIETFGTRTNGKPEIQLMGGVYQEILRKHGLRLTGKITWKKCTKGKRDFNWSSNPQANYHDKKRHTTYKIINNTEYIHIFEKDGKPVVDPDLNDRSKVSKETYYSWNDGVWEIPPVKGKKGHPAPFPEEIPRRLIELYSFIDDIVLDPFGGTMTTLKVANELGRVGIGYERDKTYKPVIMEKLGIKEKDLREPDKGENQKKDEQDRGEFGDRFEKNISEILAGEGKTVEDIRSVEVPYKSDFSKDDMVIDWKPDPEEPDPSGSPTSPVLQPDDYEEGKTYPVLVLPERKWDLAAYVNTVMQGDCLEKLKPIPDNSVDLLVTDPPYGIKFMGKDWDKAIPSVDIWKENLRVLKPGAFAFVMSAVRQDTLSRMIVSLEEAGFKTDFPALYWTYSSGFPKAYNVAKGIERKLQRGVDFKTTEANKFDGSYAGFQPKPAVEAIIVAMKPMDKKSSMEQALENGKGITWLGDCRIPYREKKDEVQYNKRCELHGKYEAGPTWGGKKVLDMPKAGNHEPCFASTEGRFPANLLVSDDVLDDGKDHTSPPSHIRNTNTSDKSIFGFGTNKGERAISYGDTGGYSRFFSLDAWAEKNLPFLIVPKSSKKEKNAGCEDLVPKNIDRTHLAVKCKKCGKYRVSSNKNNRCQCENPEWEKTKQHNSHPTVKPIALMSYLITMGSREGDVVLDPFTGSGTTCVAAKKLNRKFIGMELNKDYHAIAQKRVEYEEPIALKKAA